MNRRPYRGSGVALVPLCCLVFLPVLACAGIMLIGHQGLPSTHSPSTLTSTHQAMLPGMGATIMPRWTLGNFDPRLEGSARGESWPVPAGIPCTPDRSTTLTRFPRHVSGESLPRLLVTEKGAGQ